MQLAVRDHSELEVSINVECLLDLCSMVCCIIQTLEQENRELKSSVEDSRRSIDHLTQLSSTITNELNLANDKIKVCSDYMYAVCTVDPQLSEHLCSKS